MTNPQNVVRPMRVGEMPETEWAARLQLDECDRYILNEYRLEYKQGRKGYWKVLAVKRGNVGRKGGYITLSRLILSPPAGAQVDHVNHDTLDNRRCNLRICTPSQNQANTVRRKPETGYRGVRRSGRSFYAYVCRVRVGTFSTAAEAAQAYDEAAFERFGEFAILNFPAVPVAVAVTGLPENPNTTGGPVSLFTTAHSREVSHP